MWDELTMDQKARWMAFFAMNGVYNRDQMKRQYDSMYLSKMEKVAQDNYRNWGYKDQDQALVHALNDNTYDYNKWFADNPGSMENSDTHWTDRYKTVYHPTYSNESIYSQGPSIGGEWTKDDKFIPSVINRQQYPKVYNQDKVYTEKEIYDRLHKFDVGGPAGAVKKAMYDRMPIVGTYMLPEVDIAPEPERPNWFARQSMNAAMAENAPYMQAVGWQQDGNGNYHQNPTTPGAQELRKALFEIGINAATDVFGGPLLEKALKYGARGVQGLKNVYKSQKKLRAINKVYERALNKIPANPDGTYTPEGYEQIQNLMEQQNKAIYGDNVDISSLSYFKDEAPTKVVRRGRIVKSVQGGDKDIMRYEDVESATNEVQRRLQEQPITTSDILKQARGDFNRIRPGHTAALVDNLSLSRDSYPLLERLAQREVMHNTGKITPVIDDGNYRMIQLNGLGKYQSKKDIDRAIQGLRDVTGDVNIPNRVSLLGAQYVPAFTFTRFGNGGHLIDTGVLSMWNDWNGNEFVPVGLQSGNGYSRGGSIHINPKNKGKFNATKKRTGKTTEELTHSKNPITRKRAIFAQNAKKWNHKHQLGSHLSNNFYIESNDGNLGKLKQDTYKTLAWPAVDFLRDWYTNRQEQINNLSKYRNGTSSYYTNVFIPQLNNFDQTRVMLKPEFDNGLVYGRYLGQPLNLIEIYKGAFSNGADHPRSTIIHEGTHAINHNLNEDVQKQVDDFDGDRNQYIAVPGGGRKPLIDDSYLNNPDEINSRLMQFRYDQRLDPKHKYTDEEIQKFFDNGSLLKYNLYYSPEFVKHLINDVAYNDSTVKNGRIAAKGGQIIWDNNGQWSHPGQVTGITGTKDGTDITMNGVGSWILGIDDLGNKKLMKPGRNYHFKGGKVVEYPIVYQFGGLLGNTKFTDYAGKAMIQNMKAGLPFGQQPKYTVQNAIAPAVQSMQERHPENVQYLPQYAQDYFNMNTPQEVSAIAEYIDPFDDRNRQVYAESGGNPNAVSKAGARGLFQIMPDTMKWYQSKTKDYGDVNDPVYNERVRDWLIDYLYTTNIATADGIDDMERKRRVYAAYNGGRGTVSKAIRNYGDDWINHVPAETRNYARFIVDKQDSGGSRTNDAYTKWYYAGNQYIKKKQYGGIIRPFSYFDIPVVRFDEGGYAYI